MEEALELGTTQLRPLVKLGLLSLAESGTHSTLTPDVCNELLQEPPVLEPGAGVKAIPGSIPAGNGAAPGLAILTGYPSYPLYHRLAHSLAYWIVSGSCPVSDLPVMYLLNEQVSVDERMGLLEEAGSKLSGCYSLWGDWSEDERKHFIVDVLQILGVRGVLDLLGVRKTAGSSNLLPPPKEALLKTFTAAPHSPHAKLTVGARALSKHHHRDDSLQWWGQCTGTEDAKNEHALKLVSRIMEEATWINIHSLPHDLKVLEMRTIEGYGARWSYDGSEFRGFLEPQMEDGHLVGWKH